MTLSFRFNDIASLRDAFRKHKGQVACVIMEPTTHIQPKQGFLSEVAEVTHDNDAVFISDEISCAFRVGLATTRDCYSVDPDLVAVGKGIANGYPINALLGKAEIMRLGGIDHNEERVFLISTTFGGEMASLGAMMATINYYEKHDVLSHLWDYNKRLMEGSNRISSELGIGDKFYFEGFPGRLNYVAKNNLGDDSYEFRTLFAQEMANNGVLIPWVANSYSHKKKQLERTLEAIQRSLGIYKKALSEGVSRYLKSKPMKPVFRKYN